MKKTLTQALESLERRVVEGFERVDGRLDGIDGRPVFQRLDRMETEYHMLVVGIRRIEEQMAEDRDDRARLHAQVADLRERVKELEERLKELQERLDEEEQAAPPSKPS